MKNKFIFLEIFNRMQVALSNILQTIRPISSAEMSLVKKTGLFANTQQNHLNTIFKSARVKKYLKGKLIIAEGDLPDALYIIIEGAVRVFSYDIHQKKIPLARLSNGDYFGEQAIIGQSCKTRSASVEAIESTTLIKISSKVIFPIWQEDEKVKTKLKQIGLAQAIHSLTSSVKAYRDINNIFNECEIEATEEFAEGKTIFHAGDKPDKVYIILKGEVELFIQLSGRINRLILHKGHLFGELGVLTNKPRLATAKAKKNLRLLVIDGEHFKKVYNQHPALQHLLSTLKQTYQLPFYGMVEQYVGNNDYLGSIITNIFKMDDGRSLISVRSLTQPFFSMLTVNEIISLPYQYKKNDVIVLLKINNYRIVGIESIGDWENLSVACQMMFDNKVLSAAILDNFTVTGSLGNKLSPEIICNCMLVYKNQLQALIGQGLTNFESLSKETGAGSVCGGCRNKILEMLGENGWISAVLKKAIEHNPIIRSYYIIPTERTLNPSLPGQHITIQVKVNDIWIERTYTLSSTIDNNQLRITIKKEPKGYFTTWLFEQAPAAMEIKVGQPDGSFVLNLDEHRPALCFAGGIGCTPFFAYLKFIKKMQKNKRVHLLYCVSTANDFIFTNELQETTQTISSVTITYRETSKYGSLTKNEITTLIQSFPEADVYICGPEGFNKLVLQTLSDINYPSEKIHFEIFFHAGAKPH